MEFAAKDISFIGFSVDTEKPITTQGLLGEPGQEIIVFDPPIIRSSQKPELSPWA